ncbi:MAG: STAS domain-containing protein [Pirellulaceae bacterium]
MDNRKFTINPSTIGGILVLDLAAGKSGTDDGTSRVAGQLFEVISATSCRQVLLDLRGIQFITSDVIGQLIMLHKKCLANNHQLKLCGVTDANKMALDLVRFDKLVEFYESKPEAVAAFKAGQPPQSIEVEVSGSADDFLAQAESGDLNAQFNYGKCLEAGQGVNQDFEAAVRWYDKAAKQGHVDSQHALGVAYAYGIGVPQDFDAAFGWYKKAADQGHAEAQYWIGVSLHHGLVGEVDTGKAIKWYNEAADQGYEPAHQAIAELKRG